MNDLTPTQGTLALTHKFPAEERDLLNYFHSQKQPSLRNKELCNYTDKARSEEVNTPADITRLRNVFV